MSKKAVCFCLYLAFVSIAVGILGFQISVRDMKSVEYEKYSFDANLLLLD